MHHYLQNTTEYHKTRPINSVKMMVMNKEKSVDFFFYCRDYDVSQQKNRNLFSFSDTPQAFDIDYNSFRSHSQSAALSAAFSNLLLFFQFFSFFPFQIPPTQQKINWTKT